MEAIHQGEVAHHDSIVVAVKGLYRTFFNPPSTKASIGVFFHDHSIENVSTLLEGDYTGLSIELRAVYSALEIAMIIRNQNDSPQSGPPSPYHRLSRVVIKSDDKDMVIAMTEFMYSWQLDDYVNRGPSQVR